MKMHPLELWLLIRDHLLGSIYQQAVKDGNAEVAMKAEREMVRPPRMGD